MAARAHLPRDVQAMSSSDDSKMRRMGMAVMRCCSHSHCREGERRRGEEGRRGEESGVEVKGGEERNKKSR